MPRTRLWHLELSHYSEKARWALDFKRVPHTRRAPLPGLTALVALRLTRQRRFPLLEIDGRAINDSTRIIAALEELAPEPPLYPADAAERERALALEDLFDEQVAPALRSFAFHHLTQDPDHMLAAVVPHATGAKAAILRAGFAATRPYVRADYAPPRTRRRSTRGWTGWRRNWPGTTISWAGASPSRTSPAPRSSHR